MRLLLPYLIVSLAVLVVGAVAYDARADAWVVYAAVAIATLVASPGLIRWDDQRHPRH